MHPSSTSCDSRRPGPPAAFAANCVGSAGKRTVRISRAQLKN
ncbi:hypothetical protein L838_1896 [Mycobacterium avium MAV_120709_2344]|nr:hypothetical protein L838_1896 [Mycobacterium avium MAV_120709_2344]